MYTHIACAHTQYVQAHMQRRHHILLIAHGYNTLTTRDSLAHPILASASWCLPTSLFRPELQYQHTNGRQKASGNVRESSICICLLSAYVQYVLTASQPCSKQIYVRNSLRKTVYVFLVSSQPQTKLRMPTDAAICSTVPLAQFVVPPARRVQGKQRNSQ